MPTCVCVWTSKNGSTRWQCVHHSVVYVFLRWLAAFIFLPPSNWCNHTLGLGCDVCCLLPKRDLSIISFDEVINEMMDWSVCGFTRRAGMTWIRRSGQRNWTVTVTCDMFDFRQNHGVFLRDGWCDMSSWYTFFSSNLYINDYIFFNPRWHSLTRLIP